MLKYDEALFPEPIPLCAENPAAAPEVEVAEETEERLDAPWRVILYNDEIHTFDEVIFQLIKATGCTVAEAEAMVWKAHMEGKAAVFEGTFEECFRVQGVLNEIGLVTELEG
ncbi:ATP-dependent Clp protease adaptor ClpS [Rhodocaloribacter sp.]